MATQQQFEEMLVSFGDALTAYYAEQFAAQDPYATPPPVPFTVKAAEAFEKFRTALVDEPPANP